MNRVETFRTYEEQPDCFQQVGEYFTRIASAMTSLFKRIFCIEDPVTTQDLQWDAQKCHRVQRENRQLKQSIKDLQLRVGRLQRCDSLSTIEKVCIEAILFITLCPLYILSLPVIIIRDAMYQKNFRSNELCSF
ncbi:MAG: hypothetical protein K940chlam6_00365 [Chlamydiae bacterium]|nr:hypothetical protein [Chlamydiota bacterium]